MAYVFSQPFLVGRFFFWRHEGVFKVWVCGLLIPSLSSFFFFSAFGLLGAFRLFWISFSVFLAALVPF